MASTAIPPAEAPESGNSISRIFGALFSPKPTFASIARRPTWILPMLVITLISIGGGIVAGHRLDWRTVVEQQIQKRPAAQRRIEQLPPEQREQMLAQQAKIIPITVYVASVAGPAILMLVIGAVFLGVFNLLNGVTMKFSTSLSIVAHAWMPQVINSLLAIVILCLKDPTTIDVQNIVASNLAVFLPDGAATWMSTLLGALDLFSVWVMLLMALGYQAVNPRKLTFGKALGTIVGVWLILVLVRVGLAAAFS